MVEELYGYSSCQYVIDLISTLFSDCYIQRAHRPSGHQYSNLNNSTQISIDIVRDISDFLV